MKFTHLRKDIKKINIHYCTQWSVAGVFDHLIKKIPLLYFLSPKSTCISFFFFFVCTQYDDVNISFQHKHSDIFLLPKKKILIWRRLEQSGKTFSIDLKQQCLLSSIHISISNFRQYSLLCILKIAIFKHLQFMERSSYSKMHSTSEIYELLKSNLKRKYLSWANHPGSLYSTRGTFLEGSAVTGKSRNKTTVWRCLHF